MITRERAAEAMAQAQALAKYGPVLTREEDAEIKAHWETKPGWTSYMDAFYDFLNGRVCQGPQT